MSSDLDRRIVEELIRNPSQTNRCIATSLGVTENTIRRRIEQLVSSGDLIFTVLPNLKKLGFPIRAYILLHVDHLKIRDIADLICKKPCLRFVSHCIGFADIYARGDFASLESMSDFVVDEIGKISGISRIDTKVICKELKREYSYITTTPPEIQTTDISMNKVDLKLIQQLQKNARATLKELSHEIGVSDATIHRRIKDLVSSGTIEFRAIPSDRTIGYSAESFIGIRTELDQTRNVAEMLAQYHEARYVGYLSGPLQILAGIHASSTENLSEFATRELINIKGIIEVKTLTFLKVLKQNFTWI